MAKGDSDESKDPGFIVVDKRGVDAPEEESPPAAESAPPAGEASARALPKVDFSTFLISLGTSAMYHMGVVPDPETGKPVEPNLPLTQQTIDTIEILQEKTRGNLDADEERLLQSLLTELRMRFVEASRK